MFGLCTVEKQFKSSDWYSSIRSECPPNVVTTFDVRFITQNKILREVQFQQQDGGNLYQLH